MYTSVTLNIFSKFEYDMEIHKICCRDNRTCKHCVALLFAVSDFCCRHKDRSTEVGTVVECVWDKPRNGGG